MPQSLQSIVQLTIMCRWRLTYPLMNRLDAAVLDINADDGSGMQKQKSTYHWDKVLQAALLIPIFIVQ